MTFITFETNERLIFQPKKFQLQEFLNWKQTLMTLKLLNFTVTFSIFQVTQVWISISITFTYFFFIVEHGFFSFLLFFIRLLFLFFQNLDNNYMQIQKILQLHENINNILVNVNTCCTNAHTYTKRSTLRLCIIDVT